MQSVYNPNYNASKKKIFKNAMIVYRRYAEYIESLKDSGETPTDDELKKLEQGKILIDKICDQYRVPRHIKIR